MGGVRTATLGELAYIARVTPEPIVVSAGSEVFSDVILDYRIIPADPSVTAGDVRITVGAGSTVASLPGTLAAGQGSVTWPQGAIVDVTRPYEATLQAERDGRQMRAVPRRLRLDKVPLAVTTRDRLLRIQFALPEQGLFTTRNYSVRVFLAAGGQSFPAEPTFSVSSQRISEAAPNVEQWWPSDDATAASEQWVTLKLDRMDLPAGLDTTIRRQAFEIGTVLSGYSRLRVAVVSDGTGTELSVFEGQVTAGGDWAHVVETINHRLRQSAGQFVPMVHTIPPPDTFDPRFPVQSLGALTYRAVRKLIDDTLDVALLRGIVEGFRDSWEGDRQMVALLGQVLTSPRESAKAFASFMSEFVARVREGGGVSGMISALFSGLYSVSFTIAGQPAYYAGYLIGFLFEQVVVTVALAAATLPIGAAIARAATLIRGAAWVASLAPRLQKLARSVGYVMKTVNAAADTRAAKAAVTWVKELGPDLDNLWTKYPDAGRILERAGQAARVSTQVAKRAIYWLTVVDRMTDAAASRVIRFFERIGQDAGDLWLTRWTALPNGRRAVKDGFEAYERTGDAAEGVHDALVLAGNLDHPITGRTFPRDYATKYGTRTESTLGQLRLSPTDARYTDDAVAHTVKFHSHPEAEVPSMSDDAIEGTARSANVPCTRVASALLFAVPVVIGGCGILIGDLLHEQYGNLMPRIQVAFENLKRANDIAADEAFDRLLWAAHNFNRETAEAVIRAASFPNATPASVAEYMKAVDWMRDPADPSSIITGLLDPAETLLGSTINMRRVGNMGAGSIAEGWEPVAMRRLIEGGSPNLPRPITRGDIKSYGEKLPVGAITGGSPSTIEADCLLTDGTFFDMKHSLTGDPRIAADQIALLERVLADPVNRPIQRAVFVTNAPVGDTILGRVRAANDTLRLRYGITEDLIRVVEDLGGFPLP